MEPALRQEGQLEGGIVRDQRAAPDGRENVPGHRSHVEYGNASATTVQLHQARLGAVGIEGNLVGRLRLHLHRSAAHGEPKRGWVRVLGTWPGLDIDGDRPGSGIGDDLGNDGFGGRIIGAVDELDIER
jgi:hypothetical protein